MFNWNSLKSNLHLLSLVFPLWLLIQTVFPLSLQSSFTYWNMASPKPFLLEGKQTCFSQPLELSLLSPALWSSLWLFFGPFSSLCTSFCVVGIRTEHSIPPVAWSELSRLERWLFLSLLVMLLLMQPSIPLVSFPTSSQSSLTWPCCPQVLSTAR